jgi:hypothetical protein
VKVTIADLNRDSFGQIEAYQIAHLPGWIHPPTAQTALRKTLVCLTLRAAGDETYIETKFAREPAKISIGILAAITYWQIDDTYRNVHGDDRTTLLARGASNAKWRSGCLAPDRCVESIL